MRRGPKPNAHISWAPACVRQQSKITCRHRQPNTAVAPIQSKNTPIQAVSPGPPCHVSLNTTTVQQYAQSYAPLHIQVVSSKPAWPCSVISYTRGWTSGPITHPAPATPTPLPTAPPAMPDYHPPNPLAWATLAPCPRSTALQAIPPQNLHLGRKSTSTRRLTLMLAAAMPLRP